MHDLLRGYARELAGADGGRPGGQRAALTRLFDYYLYAAGDRDGHGCSPPSAIAGHALPPPPAIVPALAGEADARRGWMPNGRTWWRSPRTWPRTAGPATPPARRQRCSATSTPADTTRRRSPFTARPPGGTAYGDRSAEAGALNNLVLRSDLRQRRYAEAADYYRQAVALYRETARRGRPGQRARQPRLRRVAPGAGPRQARRPLLGTGPGPAPRDRRPARARPTRSPTSASSGLRQGQYAAGRPTSASRWRCSARSGPGRGGACAGQPRRGRAAAGPLPGGRRVPVQALALLREAGDRSSEADMLVSLGVVDLRQGRYRQASGHLQQALALLREAGDLSTQATVPSTAWANYSWPPGEPGRGAGQRYSRRSARRPGPGKNTSRPAPTTASPASSRTAATSARPAAIGAKPSASTPNSAPRRRKRSAPSSPPAPTPARRPVPDDGVAVRRAASRRDGTALRPAHPGGPGAALLGGAQGPIA